jgi:hypothetical protein
VAATRPTRPKPAISAATFTAATRMLVKPASAVDMLALEANDDAAEYAE